MDLGQQQLSRLRVQFEADEIVSRCCDRLPAANSPIPYEELARSVVDRADLHILGRDHSMAVAGELRSRARDQGRLQAADFIASQLRRGSSLDT